MDALLLETIFNFRRLTDCVATAGQPSKRELAVIAATGYQVVINLDQGDAEYALADEGACVRALGMEYLHIPVAYDRPTAAVLGAFMNALDARAGSKLFIHCAANRRVSVFMALYRVLRLGWPVNDAWRPVLDIWQPNAVWKTFFDDVVGSRGAGITRSRKPSHPD